MQKQYEVLINGPADTYISKFSGNMSSIVPGNTLPTIRAIIKKYAIQSFGVDSIVVWLEVKNSKTNRFTKRWTYTFDNKEYYFNYLGIYDTDFDKNIETVYNREHRRNNRNTSSDPLDNDQYFKIYIQTTYSPWRCTLNNIKLPSFTQSDP